MRPLAIFFAAAPAFVAPTIAPMAQVIYAIDDAGLADTFADWADLGGGAYFSAENEHQLAEALTAAT